MRRRLAILLVATLIGLLATAGWAEWYARENRLDLRDQKATLMGKARGEATAIAAPPDWGLAYLPRRFALLEGGGFRSAWGECKPDFPGKTILAFGDSTTRSAGKEGAQPRTPEEEARFTWPARLDLGKDVQVCVLAEDGYQPVDQLALMQKVLPGLKVDLIIGLLCFNDGHTMTPSISVAVPEGVALYSMPRHWVVYPPLYQPWLLKQSEAFRYLHRRLAEKTGKSIQVPTRVPEVPAATTFRAISKLGPPLQLWYLPHLSGKVEEDRETQRAVAAAGLPLNVVQLTGTLREIQREYLDRVHISDFAHGQVAQQMRAKVPF